MSNYFIQQDPNGWSVWRFFQHSGGRLEWLADHSTRFQALADIDRRRVVDIKQKELTK